MSLFQLALANLTASKLTSAVNILMLALGTAIIAVLLIVTAQLSSALTKNAAGIDLVIGAEGSPLQLVLAGVYHADVPPGNIASTEVDRWLGHPMVASAIPLSLGDSYRGFRIVGTTPEYLSLYNLNFSEGTLWRQPFDAVIGYEVAQSTSLKVGDSFSGSHGLIGDVAVINQQAHEHARYRITGALAPTGSVADSLILTSTQSVWLMHASENGNPDHNADRDNDNDNDNDNDHRKTHTENHEVNHRQNKARHDHHDKKGPDHGTVDQRHDEAEADRQLASSHGEEITLLLVQLSSPLGALTLPREVNAEADLQAASPAYEITRLLKIVGVGLNWVNAFAGILVLGAGLSIFAALYSSLSARRRDLAVMRCLGATRLDLFYLLFLEGFLLTAGGVTAGLTFAHGGVEILSWWLGQAQGISLSGWAWVPTEYLLIAGLLLLGSVTAMLPAWQAYQTNVARTLSTH